MLFDTIVAIFTWFAMRKRLSRAKTQGAAEEQELRATRGIESYQSVCRSSFKSYVRVGDDANMMEGVRMIAVLVRASPVVHGVLY